MYTIAYYVNETKGQEVVKREHRTREWRLRRTALNFVRDLERRSYIQNGYAVEDVKDGINCYKSNKEDKGVRKITEISIRVEKVK